MVQFCFFSVDGIDQVTGKKPAFCKRYAVTCDLLFCRSRRLVLDAAAQMVPDVIAESDEESGNVADLEAFIGGTITFQVDALYSQEQYDVILL